MAKALFHKSQRVYVKPVGTWALIEKVVPHWVKDVDEPLRVTYECGLGREFQAHELASEHARDVSGHLEDESDMLLEHWHIVRKPAHWRRELRGLEMTAVPETFPVVVTDEGEWGGWRVPGAAYDRDPQRVEHQARMIVNTPELVRLARRMAEIAFENPNDLPSDMLPLLKRAAGILRQIYQVETEEEIPAA